MQPVCRTLTTNRVAVNTNFDLLFENSLTIFRVFHLFLVNRLKLQLYLSFETACLLSTPVVFKLFLVVAHSEVFDLTEAHLELLHQTYSSTFTLLVKKTFFKTLLPKTNHAKQKNLEVILMSINTVLSTHNAKIVLVFSHKFSEFWA